jgi:hypothetical protein
MTKLTQAQHGLLTQAAAREDGRIDRPDDAKAAVNALIKRGLMIATPIDGGGSRLLITQAGRAAVAAPAADVPAEAPPAAPAGDSEAQPPPEAPAPKGKIGQLVALLRREEGAGIEEMMQATGWQAHSVRGAISGSIKKALGLEVVSEKIDGERRYRIATETRA